MCSDFLRLAGKTVAVFGVANRKSVAYAVAATLEAAGARVLYVVKDQATRDTVRKLLGADRTILICDVTDDRQVDQLRLDLERCAATIHGIVHSIANASYSQGFGAFHDTIREDFLNAMDVSCFSLITVVNALKDLLAEHSSVVTISISTTRMAAENYGYMAPVKAALDSTVAFLAKSMSRFGNIRVNAVGAGLLKTSASAAIPGYVDSYLYAERVTPRGRTVTTQEVADAVTFLISERAGGINAQTIVADAGMEINYFDRDIVKTVVDHPTATSQKGQ